MGFRRRWFQWAKFHTLTNPENQNSNFKKPRWVETRQENIQKFQNDWIWPQNDLDYDFDDLKNDHPWGSKNVIFAKKVQKQIVFDEIFRRNSEIFPF